ncbi:Ribosomal protein [Senna tora]|uniref:Ribosomal protein n=1 Tax=Senna tora TaxID=362788 RepID=A0A834SKS2_9FABA|nr:Ribosomal protein [Senna tora]
MAPKHRNDKKKKGGMVKLKMKIVVEKLLLLGGRKSSSNNYDDEVPEDVKEGHFAVIAEDGGMSPKRFVVPLRCLTHPTFLKLLEEAAEEYGFEQEVVVEQVLYGDGDRWMAGPDQRSSPLRESMFWEYITANVVDRNNGRIVATASTAERSIKESLECGRSCNAKAAAVVGEVLAMRLKVEGLNEGQGRGIHVNVNKEVRKKGFKSQTKMKVLVSLIQSPRQTKMVRVVRFEVLVVLLGLGRNDVYLLLGLLGQLVSKLGGVYSSGDGQLAGIAICLNGLHAFNNNVEFQGFS